MKFCENCGRELSGEKFCPNCGNEIEMESETVIENKEQTKTDNVAADIPATTENTNEVVANVATSVKNVKNLPKQALIAVAAVIVIIIAVIAITANSGPNFKKIYKNHCESVWAEVGSDNSFLTIDTNPFDEEDEGLAYYEAYTAVKTINEKLGLPASLFEEMGNTTSADGKQNETYGKVSVSWKYHPDSGLEVIYKKN